MPSNFLLPETLPVNPVATDIPAPWGVSLAVDKGFVINRRGDAFRVYRDGTETNYGSSEDDSLLAFQDITPNADGDGELMIVDIDGPSPGGLAGDSDVRLRGNFTQWTTFTYEVGGTNTVVRCSNDYEWGIRIRFENDGTGTPRFWTNDVNGNGSDDPGDDFPDDDEGENEIILGGHTTTGL